MAIIYSESGENRGHCMGRKLGKNRGHYIGRKWGKNRGEGVLDSDWEWVPNVISPPRV